MDSSDLLSKVEALEHSIDLLRAQLDDKQPKISISNYKSALQPIKCLFIESLKLEAHGDRVYSLSWAGGDLAKKFLASVSGDGRVIIWNSYTGNPSCEWVVKDTNPTLMACAFEKTTSQLLAAGSFIGKCYIFQIEMNRKKKIEGKNKPLMTFQAHQGYLSSLSFITPKNLVTCSGDSTVCLWDLPKIDLPVHKFEEHTEDVMTIDTCKANPYLVLTGSCDKTVKLWDLRQQNSSGTSYTHQGDVNCVKFLHDSNNTFLSGSSDGFIRLFDIRALREVGIYNAGRGVEALEVSKSGRIIICGTDRGDVMLWDVINEERSLQNLPGHSDKTTSVELSPDGIHLATSSFDNTVVLWQHAHT